MELKKWSTGWFGGSYVFSISHFVFLKLALSIIPNSSSKNVYFLKFFPRNIFPNKYHNTSTMPISIEMIQLPKAINYKL